MKVQPAFRYELDPNRSQRVWLAKQAGAARFAGNWGLWRIQSGESKPNGAALHREWNVWKRRNAPWWTEVSKCAPQEAFRDLERAFRARWNGRTNGREVGFLKFKKKRASKDAFRLTGAIRIEDERHVRLPRIGRLRVKESMRKFRGRILSATVRREADRWFVSLCVEVERTNPKRVDGPMAMALS